MAGELHPDGLTRFVVRKTEIATLATGGFDTRGDPVRGHILEIKEGNDVAIVIVAETAPAEPGTEET